MQSITEKLGAPPVLPSVKNPPSLRELTLNITVSTPMAGGGVEAGIVNEKRPVRVPSIKGHMRYWWRMMNLNRPDKTAEAYESCPFNEFRMYHTGDIVRYRHDGNVEFVGRKDGQVKIRGFRIETKEIESVIRNFGGVKDATVQAYDYESGGKYLAAFVVSDNAIDTEKLREFIKSQKPAYMVPAVIMQIDKVPLTVNQKVDKKALPKPELQRREYVAPSGKTEEGFLWDIRRNFRA